VICGLRFDYLQIKRQVFQEFFEHDYQPDLIYLFNELQSFFFRTKKGKLFGIDNNCHVLILFLSLFDWREPDIDQEYERMQRPSDALLDIGISGYKNSKGLKEIMSSRIISFSPLPCVIGPITGLTVQRVK
jgi:hypothetical protein